MRLLCLSLAVLFGLSETARAFCGFYVASADGALFNTASKVVLARRGDRTTITMASDVDGDPREFAVVIPVPTVVKRDQVRVADPAAIDHIDAYTAPRLVEYHDPDPCAPLVIPAPMTAMMRRDAVGAAAGVRGSDALGVKIEAQYSVGDYDIVVLSAEDSSGLLVWLKGNGYRIPDGAAPVVGSYLKQGMKFFLAKVNLERHQASGTRYLRPIQVSYNSRKFMLPIRLGTVNARGKQDLLIYALTERGRVETTNYPTMKLPTGQDVPLFVRAGFPTFYRALFDRQAARYYDSVFLEYAWDMNACDPCSAPPLEAAELRDLGADWVDGSGRTGQAAFVTRLHVRYDRERFPEDLVLQETADHESFQARYVLNEPFTGQGACPAMAEYRTHLAARRVAEAENLASLTGWAEADIRARMTAGGEALP